MDPERDKGIYLHLRREDDQKNRCDIRVRVFLAKAVKQGPEELAQMRIDEFRGRHESPKGPERPKRSAPGAFRWKQAGRAQGGVVVEEERWVLEHENGRMYEFEVLCYGAASRAFQKDIAAFWRSVKFGEK